MALQFVIEMSFFFCSSCSHKKKVLNFLDQLISFYEHYYMLASSVNAQGNEALLEKVSELAEANGLPSKGYTSALSEFSFDKCRSHLNKVYNFINGLRLLDFLHASSHGHSFSCHGSSKGPFSPPIIVYFSCGSFFVFQS